MSSVYALAVTFSFTPAPGTPQEAVDGFAEAGDLWSQHLRDNITVNVTIAFTSLDPGVLGSASSEKVRVTYSAWHSAVDDDVTSADDATGLGALPAPPDFDVWINLTSDNPNGSGSATPYLDDDGDDNNASIRMTRVNAKALVVVDPHDAASDASISFNSDYNWDFDRSNGIDGSSFDFVGVAAHELGHVLGFVSGVDVLDINGPPEGGPFAASVFTYVSPPDMRRFSTDSLLQGPAVIDWTADTRDKFFSIDGGLGNLGEFSTSTYHGDGRQASHWKDDLGLGIMDPTAAPGELMAITGLDLQLYFIIGYDGVDTPALDPLASPDTDGDYTVSWLSATGAVRYELQEATAASYALSDGAEAGTANWDTLPRWEVSSQQSHSGGNSFRCSTVGEGTHPMTLESEILIGDTSAIDFWAKVYYFATDEGVQFQVSTNRDAGWDTLWEYRAASMPSHQDWTQISPGGLLAYTGSPARVRFHHFFEGSSYYSGDDYNYIGAFIDDVDISNVQTLNWVTVSDTITATSRALSGRTDGRYYYRVRGIDVSGSAGHWSNVENLLVDILAGPRFLTINSVYGMADPPTGVHSYAEGTLVTCEVTNSPAMVYEATRSAQVVCTGWVGMGSAPAAGVTTTAGPFPLNTDSSVTWLWAVSNLWLSNQTVTVTADENALGGITAGDGYLVDPPGDVTFEAGIQVRLQPGFTALSGSVFRAVIEP